MLRRHTAPVSTDDGIAVRLPTLLPHAKAINVAATLETTLAVVKELSVIVFE